MSWKKRLEATIWNRQRPVSWVVQRRIVGSPLTPTIAGMVRSCKYWLSAGAGHARGHDIESGQQLCWNEQSDFSKALQHGGRCHGAIQSVKMQARGAAIDQATTECGDNISA